LNITSCFIYTFVGKAFWLFEGFGLIKLLWGITPIWRVNYHKCSVYKGNCYFSKK